MGLSFLEIIVPNFPNDLRKSERPDFVSNEIGLEVTKAQTNIGGQTVGIVRDYKNKSYKEIPNSKLKNAGFNEEPSSIKKDSTAIFHTNYESYSLDYFKVTNEFKLGGYHMDVNNVYDLENICFAISKKINKLRNCYNAFPSNRLLVVVDSFLDLPSGTNQVNKFELDLLSRIKDIYRDVTTIGYGVIYTLFWDSLLEIDTFSWNLNGFKITEKMFNKAEDRYRENKTKFNLNHVL